MKTKQGNRSIILFIAAGFLVLYPVLGSLQAKTYVEEGIQDQTTEALPDSAAESANAQQGSCDQIFLGSMSGVPEEETMEDEYYEDEEYADESAETCYADIDCDGLADDLDDCPEIPNNLDTDADGVVDCYDNCPWVPNPGQEDVDQDAFGDACPEDKQAYEEQMQGQTVEEY